MTAVSKRDVTKSWREIAVPNPTVRSELYLALRIAEQQYEDAHGRKANTDDAFEVHADDEEIIIRFELPTQETR